MVIRLLPLVLLSFSPLFAGKAKLGLKLEDQRIYVEKYKDKELLDLVDIHDVNKNILLDIRYATENNIFHEAFYSSAKCYFRKHIAHELDKIQKELEPMGLGLKIWDGYRPWQVQMEGYERFPALFAKPNEDRVKHPRGTAVDLTLVDKDGKEVLMPTEFDDATEKAKRECRKGLDERAIENREVLEQIMVKHGFIPLAHEWWHFDHYTWKAFPAIKLTFEEVEQILSKRNI